MKVATVTHSLYLFVGLEKPTFDMRCKIYELDPCDGFGKVCLVYKENKTGT